MSNNKQSSVTELYNKMMQYVPIEYHELVREEIPLEKYEAKHKEEIENAFVECWKANMPDGYECKLSAKEYYNETFGSLK